jgi:hypothetical protein
MPDCASFAAKNRQCRTASIVNGAEKCIVCILSKRLKSVVIITGVFIVALKCHRITIIHTARNAWNIKKRMARNTVGGKMSNLIITVKSRRDK